VARIPRRIDVDAAEKLRLLRVEDGVVERLVSGDSASWRARSFLSCSYVIPSGGHRHASPYLAHSRSREPMTAGVVDVGIGLADRAKVVAGREVDTLGMLETLRQPRHRHRL
jgi:hypothetical protein